MSKRKRYIRQLAGSWQLLVLFAPVFLYYVVFHYIPMAGILVAFQDFKGYDGLVEFFTKNWVGLRWFREFFSSIYFGRIIRNTFLLSFYGLIWGWPFPIAFALLLNETRNGFFKKFVQTTSYLPYFISTVVVVGMVVNFLSPNDGILNVIRNRLGLESVNFMLKGQYFRTIYIASGIWQGFGFSSIIYIAALAGVDPTLYEAAEIDGAGRWQKMLHISIPGISSTIIILLILSAGSLLSVGFEKIILMYNSSIYEVADVISTYVYRAGILEARFSFASAVGLLSSVVNFILLVVVNTVARRAGEISLW